MVIASAHVCPLTESQRNEVRNITTASDITVQLERSEFKGWLDTRRGLRVSHTIWTT